MCASKECTLKTQCYRYRAVPGYYQSYCNFYRGQGANVISNFDCFIPIEKEDKSREE